MPDKAPADLVRKVLFTALDALRDYLADIVIVGGWVPQVYSWLEKSGEISVLSFDVDAAVRAKLPVRGEKSIAELMQGAGFHMQTSDAGFALAAFGKKRRQVTQFFYRKGRLEVPIEFITPLVGRGEDTSVVIQGGLVAPALRFTEILLAHSQTVSLTGETLDDKKKRFTFRVPTLPAFVYGKGLIFERRESDKKGKDLAYIYETLKRPDWRRQGSPGPAMLALQYPELAPSDVRADSFKILRDFFAELK